MAAMRLNCRSINSCMSRIAVSAADSRSGVGLSWLAWRRGSRVDRWRFTCAIIGTRGADVTRNKSRGYETSAGVGTTGRGMSGKPS
jgi:hypothetical protein